MGSEAMGYRTRFLVAALSRRRPRRGDVGGIGGVKQGATGVAICAAGSRDRTRSVGMNNLQCDTRYIPYSCTIVRVSCDE
eukprot:3759909-Prymnesium_polylepis.1